MNSCNFLQFKEHYLLLYHKSTNQEIKVQTYRQRGLITTAY